MSRTFRKASTLVILGLIILVCIVMPLGMNAVMRAQMSGYYSQAFTSFETAIAQLNSQITVIDKHISGLDISDESELTRNKLLEEKQNYEDQIETYDFLISAGKKDDSSTDLINFASQDLLSYLGEIRRSERIPAEEITLLQTEYISFLNSAIETIKKLPQTLDFSAYIDVRNKDLEYKEQFYAMRLNNSAVTNEYEPESPNYYGLEPEMEIENTRLITRIFEEFLLIDPSGGTDGTHDFNTTQSFANRIQELKDSLSQGGSIEPWTGERQPLTNARREWVEDSIQIIDYQIKNSTYPVGLDSWIASMSKFPTVLVAKFILAVLLIMIAGATISQEIATGSIKSLIIAPVRRWKIFVSKWLVILTIFFLGLVIISALSDLLVIAVCGSGSLSDYTYVVNDGVRTIPFFIYNLLSLLVECADILFVIVVALMLSSLLRNTALSVALSVGLYASILIYTLSAAERGMPQDLPKFPMDFFPFSNFNLVSDLFKYRIYTVDSELVEQLMSTQSMSRPGLLFSSVYLVLVLSCLFLIAMDSFTRRDIK